MNISGRRLAAVGTTLGVAAAAATVALLPDDTRSTAPVAAKQAAWRMVPGTVAADASIGGLAAIPNGGMWAVGNYNRQVKPLLERLTTNGWTRVTLPKAVADIRPNDVHGSSANDVWVTGRRSVSGNERVLHWNGSAWKAYDLGAGFFANEVRSFGPRSAWIIGAMPDARYWNGSSWAKRTLAIHPRSLSGVSAKDVWAVGHHDRKPAVSHWNGTSWRRVALPAIPGLVADSEIAPALTDVHAVSSKNVWAVGTVSVKAAGKTTRRALLVRWNGTKWNVAVGAAGTGYTQIEPDGSGGFWFAYGSVLKHRSATGVWTTTTVARPSSLPASVNVLAHRPGTKTVWAGGYLRAPDGYDDPGYWRND